MRLIDADEIYYNTLLKTGNKEHPLEWAVTHSQIDKTPTIEWRKMGEWLFPYGDKKYKRCSVCERDYYSIPHTSNFCPNCGADMRGERHG